MRGSPGSSVVERKLLLVVAVAVQCACTTASSLNERGIENVVNRAQFDLDCPRDRLRLAPLQYDGDVVTSYGVIGCGRRGAYVRAGRNTFVLEQNRHASPPSPPPSAPRPK